MQQVPITDLELVANTSSSSNIKIILPHNLISVEDSNSSSRDERADNSISSSDEKFELELYELSSFYPVSALQDKQNGFLHRFQVHLTCHYILTLSKLNSANSTTNNSTKEPQAPTVSVTVLENPVSTQNTCCQIQFVSPPVPESVIEHLLAHKILLPTNNIVDTSKFHSSSPDSTLLDLINDLNAHLELFLHSNPPTTPNSPSADSPQSILVRDFAYPIGSAVHWGRSLMQAAGTPLRQVRALYDFEAQDENELAFNAGDVINVVYERPDGWLVGMMNGISGLVPINHVEWVVSNSAACDTVVNTVVKDAITSVLS